MASRATAGRSVGFTPMRASWAMAPDASASSGFDIELEDLAEIDRQRAIS
jgi:hypothetical protein